jgi:L-ascorbate 6-phosphate lactonase
MHLETNLDRVIRERAVAPGALEVFWLGQASFVYKGSSGRTVAVDPYFSDIVERLVGWQRLWLPSFPASDLAVDVVVTTHNHVDHLDPEAITEIVRANSETIFVGPTSCVDHFRHLGIPEERIVRLDRGQAATVKGVHLEAMRADHMTVGDEEPFAIGVVMELDGVRVYQAGDTVYNTEIAGMGKALGPVDILTVPINGNYAVMNSLDAALFSRDVGPRVVIPCHYGMFANNTADPYLFVHNLKAGGVNVKPVVMAVQSSYTYWKA